MRAFKRALLTLAGAGLIAGCSATNDYQDIKAFMDEVDARGKGQIEPLPEFLPYQAFAYGAGNMRSPFDLAAAHGASAPTYAAAICRPCSGKRKALTNPSSDRSSTGKGSLGRSSRRSRKAS